MRASSLSELFEKSKKFFVLPKSCRLYLVLTVMELLKRKICCLNQIIREYYNYY